MDKQEILVEYEHESSKTKDLSFKTLATVYLFLFLSLMIFLPMIYIKNQIYYISRDFGKQISEYEVLIEENRRLKLGIETVRFKYQVLDVLGID